MVQSSIGICTRCNSRYSRMSMNTDFVHNCEVATSEVLRNEDVLTFQTSFQNPDGTSGTQPAGGMLFKGIENGLFGTRAWLEGHDNETLTSRGNAKNRYRTRTHFEYIDNSNK